MSASKWLVTGAVALAAIATACGDDFESGGGGGSTTVPCNEDPWSCPAGQTCWSNDTGAGFACLNSGSGLDGEACENYLGTPTCTDAHGCVQLNEGQPGLCAPFCDPSDPAHACPEGRLCQMYNYAGSIIRMCAH